MYNTVFGNANHVERNNLTEKIQPCTHFNFAVGFMSLIIVLSIPVSIQQYRGEIGAFYNNLSRLK